MDFNLPANIEHCSSIVIELLPFLLYTHLSSAIAALAIGIVVYLKSRNNQAAKILFTLSVFFSMWAGSNLIIWFFFNKNSLLMSFWAPIDFFALVINVLCLYFCYVFLEKREPSVLMKCVGSFPIIIAAFWSVLGMNIEGFNAQECIAIDNALYLKFIYLSELVYSLWTGAYLTYKYCTNKTGRDQVFFLLIGVSVFLLSFLIFAYLADVTENFVFEAAGLFGMVFFVGFLGYLIVRFEAFSIKTFTAQALVYSLVFVVASEFLFATNTLSQLLILLSLLLVIIFGRLLIGSVRQEIRQRLEIESLASSLKKANEELRDLDRQKDELLGIVAHQLAKPITAIRWDLESLLDGDLGALNDEQRSEAESMRTQAIGLADLVSMILDVSRIQLGRIQLDPRPLDLNELFKEIMDVIKPTIAQKNIHFVQKMPETLPTVYLDKRYTRMTIENLLTNAVKYTPEGGKVTLDIKIEKGVMCCAVSDTGCGIPKADQAKIFGKMYRASNVVNTVEGNGFGLYVAKGAVEGQGGTIGFESTEGKGTKFFLTLPMKEVPVQG